MRSAPTILVAAVDGKSPRFTVSAGQYREHTHAQTSRQQSTDMAYPVWLLANNSISPPLLVTQLVSIAIWAGLGALILALLVLMRTRLGQVEPLSKCVVLSVFAHLLLLFLAHGTRLLEVPASVGDDEVIQLAFVSMDRPSEEGERPAEPIPQDEFLVPGEIPQPEAPQAQRRDVESEPVPRQPVLRGPGTAGKYGPHGV